MNELHALAALPHAASWSAYGMQNSGGPSFLLVTWVPVGLLLCVAVLVAIVSRARNQRRHLDLLQEALRNPALTPQAQVEIVRLLQPRSPRRWMFSLGWFGLFGGIGWLCSDPPGDKLTAAIVLTVLSFALITLPLALRELEARSA
jgi:hypothetical protein